MITSATTILNAPKPISIFRNTFHTCISKARQQSKPSLWMSLTFNFREFSTIGIAMTIIIIAAVGPSDRWKIAKVSATVAANAAAEKQ